MTTLKFVIAEISPQKNIPIQMTLLRGLPGSGKTTFASIMMDDDDVLVSADLYFIRNGRYEYNPRGIAKAHVYTLTHAMQALKEGFHVWVDNTFTQWWEMANYVAMADTLDIGLRVIDLDIRPISDKDMLERARRNRHGVPYEAIKAMVSRYNSADIIAQAVESVMEMPMVTKNRTYRFRSDEIPRQGPRVFQSRKHALNRPTI